MVKLSDSATPSLLFTEHVDPSNPSAGTQRLFVDTDHILKMIDSSGTVTLFGGGLSDPMTTRGDIIVRNASNVTARLPIGSSTYVLTSDGTDVAWAAASGGGSGALTLLSSNVLGSPAADITVTGISGSYKDLVLVVTCRSALSANVDDLYVQVGNGSIDTGSNYAEYSTYEGSAAGTVSNSSTTKVWLGVMAAASLTAGHFSQHEVVIANYISSSTSRNVLGEAAAVYGAVRVRSRLSGGWTNTSAAIDRVKVFANGGNLATGTKFYLYGRG